jgi:formyltetrahydrofolate-dependent phosphoribosylglycinamide formyltransferase
MASSPINLAVLLSGSGTTLQNLIDRIASGELNARIGVVIASKPGLVGTERAAKAKLPNFVVDRRDFAGVPEFSKQIFSLCDDAGAELLCLAGWLCLLDIPDRYTGRIMNIHPALLPAFGGKGMYGHKVHQAVIDYGCKISGCTVHFADNTYDTGPIVIQRTCPVLEDDTPDTLAHRVFEEEKLAYPEAIRLFQEGRLTVEGRRVRIAPAPAPRT